MFFLHFHYALFFFLLLYRRKKGFPQHPSTRNIVGLLDPCFKTGQTTRVHHYCTLESAVSVNFALAWLRRQQRQQTHSPAPECLKLGESTQEAAFDTAPPRAYAGRVNLQCPHCRAGLQSIQHPGHGLSRPFIWAASI